MIVCKLLSSLYERYSMCTWIRRILLLIKHTVSPNARTKSPDNLFLSNTFVFSRFFKQFFDTTPSNIFCLVFSIAKVLLLKPLSAFYPAFFLHHAYLFLSCLLFLFPFFRFPSFLFSSFISSTLPLFLFKGRQWDDLCVHRTFLCSIMRCGASKRI